MADPRARAADELGLRRAVGDVVLPLVVAAMAFLAALAAAGVVGARTLARQWQTGAEASLTVQVPEPDQMRDGQSRIERALAVLRADPAVAAARALASSERAALLRPWFDGADPPPALPLPGVIDARLAPGATASGLGATLEAAVPGATLASPEEWTGRLRRLAASLQACAWLCVAIVAAVAAVMVAVATRGGLLARRDSIQIVHGLGATDGYIARRFAGRATVLAAGGAGLGALASLPVLLALAALAAPFAAPVAVPVAGAAAGGAGDRAWFGALGDMPGSLWLTLLGLPVCAAAIGFGTASLTVRRWLRRLP